MKIELQTYQLLNLQVYGTNKTAVEGFGGSTPNLGDTVPMHVPTNSQGPRKAKSGIVFGHSNISYNEGRTEFYFLS